MKNELLKIGPFTIYGYGVMIAIGIVAAYLVAEHRAKKLRMAYEHIFYLVIWCVMGDFLAQSFYSGLRNGSSLSKIPCFSCGLWATVSWCLAVLLVEFCLGIYSAER